MILGTMSGWENLVRCPQDQSKFHEKISRLLYQLNYNIESWIIESMFASFRLKIIHGVQKVSFPQSWPKPWGKKWEKVIFSTFLLFVEHFIIFCSKILYWKLLIQSLINYLYLLALLCYQLSFLPNKQFETIFFQTRALFRGLSSQMALWKGFLGFFKNP